MDEAKETAFQLNVHVDFNKLQAKLGHAVDRCVRLVSIGFQCSPTSTTEDIRMPGTGWSVSFSGATPWSAEEAEAHYTGWLFATGLRDVLEAFGAFVDECYDISSVLHLRVKHKERGLIGQDFFNYQADSAKYKRLGIDKKLQKLKSFETLPSEVRESVLSVNRARNILAHHEGLVPESYLNESARFRVSWSRLIMVAMGGSEREVRIGEPLRAGEGLGMRIIWEHRDFSKGDRLLLQPSEFAGVSWTIFTAGNTIRETLEKEWTETVG